MNAPGLFAMARELYAAGFYAGPRDPARNQAFPGAWMVAESIDVGPTRDASTGGYCIVGEDLEDLMRTACEDFALGPQA